MSEFGKSLQGILDDGGRFVKISAQILPYFTIRIKGLFVGIFRRFQQIFQPIQVRRGE